MIDPFIDKVLTICCSQESKSLCVSRPAGILLLTPQKELSELLMLLFRLEVKINSIIDRIDLLTDSPTHKDINFSVAETSSYTSEALSLIAILTKL